MSSCFKTRKTDTCQCVTHGLLQGLKSGWHNNIYCVLFLTTVLGIYSTENRWQSRRVQSHSVTRMTQKISSRGEACVSKILILFVSCKPYGQFIAQTHFRVTNVMKISHSFYILKYICSLNFNLLGLFCGFIPFDCVVTALAPRTGRSVGRKLPYQSVLIFVRSELS